MNKERRICRCKEVMKKVGVSRSTLDRWEKDKGFPKRVHLGENSIGWFEDEIDAWLNSKMENI